MAAAAISIEDYNLPDQTHALFDVNFYGDTIRTLVTHTPSIVDSWVSDIESDPSLRRGRAIVGLDIEWRPNDRYHENPAATLQLCTGRRCLIFQLLYAPHIPQTLIRFLANPGFTFVGVGISGDVTKLGEDYNVEVLNTVDLRPLAAAKLGMRSLSNAGLKTLAREVLGKEISKPERVTRSRWDMEGLTLAQIQYACLDAFLSSEIGRSLNASD